MGAKKRYIPKSRHNPEVQARRIDQLKDEIENQRRLLEIVTLSYDRHMEHLSAFAKHDLGNAIQSMYAVLKMLSKKLSVEDHLALKTAIDNMNNTLANFESLVSYTKTGTFSLTKLMAALEVMTRFSASAEHIECTFIYDREVEFYINQPFQSILQLLQNLTLNSIKALKDCTGEKKIEIAAEVDGEFCIIAIKDTGCGIKDEDVNRVFDYKFTTTNGCGIGLYHAKYVCDEIGGEISFQRNVDVFSTVFIIKFPVNGTKEDINN